MQLARLSHRQRETYPPDKKKPPLSSRFQIYQYIELHHGFHRAESSLAIQLRTEKLKLGLAAYLPG